MEFLTLNTKEEIDDAIFCIKEDYSPDEWKLDKNKILVGFDYHFTIPETQLDYVRSELGINDRDTNYNPLIYGKNPTKEIIAIEIIPKNQTHSFAIFLTLQYKFIVSLSWIVNLFRFLYKL